MKGLLYTAIISILALTLVISCEKDDSGTKPDPSPPETEIGEYWLPVSSNSAENLYSITRSDSIFLIGGDKSVFSSEQGISWESSLTGRGNPIYDIEFNGIVFLAIEPEVVVRSAYGENWSSAYAYITDTLVGIATAGKSAASAIAVGSDGQIIGCHGESGSPWGRIVDAPTSRSYNGICYVNDRFLAVGIDTSKGSPHAVISVSSPGYEHNWDHITLTQDYSINDIAMLDNKFVAVCDSGRMLVSSDIQVWTEITSPVTVDLNAIITVDSTLIAVGDSGRIITSTDTENWETRDSGVLHDLYDIIASDDMIVTVGAKGIIVTSEIPGK